ncbi:hypothetical protein [Streptomyces sp. Ac-502]|uniref:hypothetical protein n=1 Tax=Streptomyces sp. Ac-502 TaxID=3342801 RepID=UPI0038626528
MDDEDVKPKLLDGWLRTEFQRLVMADPEQALSLVDQLVLTMHSEALAATDAARRAGLGWQEIGRAHALLEDAGILLRQAAAVLLGLPAADRAAETEMVAQALAEGDAEEHQAVMPEQRLENDVWTAAVERFQGNTRIKVLTDGAPVSGPLRSGGFGHHVAVGDIAAFSGAGPAAGEAPCHQGDAGPGDQ